jgi:hypothetical protein
MQRWRRQSVLTRRIGPRRARVGARCIQVTDALPGMRFQWDWLSPVVAVPYVPTLGPVEPGVLSAKLFNAVVDVADTGLFLPYDKDRRWSRMKDERVIVNEIIHEPDRTVIPTLSTRGRSLMKIYYYGNSTPRLSETTEWSRTWCATSGVAAGRVIWFQSTSDGARTRLMLKRFADQDKHHYGRVMNLEDCDVADTFPAFAEELGADGFAFLYSGSRPNSQMVRFSSRSTTGASSGQSAPWESCSTPPGRERSRPSTSPCIPTIGTEAMAGLCGERRWRGARRTGPSTKFSKPHLGAHLSCSTCPKDCPRSGSCAAGAYLLHSAA